MQDELALSNAIARIAAELHAIREIADERDRRYDERDQANKDAVKTALLAVEKAADKLEVANKEYKNTSNEWRGTLNDVVGRMVKREDVEREIKGLERQIADLRESRSVLAGRDSAVEQLLTQARLTQRFLIAIGVTVAIAIVANFLR